MAKIEFTGFVEEILEGRNGTYGIKVAEPHRRKDDNDQWQTVARTFHRVTGAYGADIEWGGFSKGDRVDVTGKQVTDPYTDNGGKKQYPLVVKADTVTPATGQQRPAVEPEPWGQPDPWPTPDESLTPF
jgi:single-stranded DNA-binding protein